MKTKICCERTLETNYRICQFLQSIGDTKEGFSTVPGFALISGGLCVKGCVRNPLLQARARAGYGGIDPREPGFVPLRWNLTGRQPQYCPGRFMYKQQRANWLRSGIHVVGRSCSWQIMIVSFYTWEVMTPAMVLGLRPLHVISPHAIMLWSSTRSSPTTEVHEDYLLV